MKKHTREKVAGVSFTIAIVIGLAFMAVYALRISMPQVPVIIPRIAIGIEIIAILVYLWSDR